MPNQSQSRLLYKSTLIYIRLTDARQIESSSHLSESRSERGGSTKIRSYARQQEATDVPSTYQHLSPTFARLCMRAAPVAAHAAAPRLAKFRVSNIGGHINDQLLTIVFRKSYPITRHADIIYYIYE